MQTESTNDLILELHSTRDCMTQVVETLSEAFEGLRLPEDATFDIKLATQEAVVNAVEHGNGADERKMVRVRCHTNEDTITVTVSDEGNGFDPGSVPNPTLPENILKESGRGLFLIHQLCDEVRFNDRGNEITFVKKIARGE